MNKHKPNFALLSVGVLVLMVLVNLLSLKTFFRIDLTRDHKYTLAEASKITLQGLTDTITVSAYFTEGLPPPYAQNARYVRDLLDEYRSASHGRFGYEFIDPMASETASDKETRKALKRDIFGRFIREPTSVERELTEVGLEPVEIRVIADDQQQTKRAYMGLVVRYQGKHEVIPIVQNPSDLEKELTTLMRRLVRTKTPKIAVIKSQELPGIGKFIEAASQNVEMIVTDLSSPDTKLDDFDAVMVVGSGEHFGADGAGALGRYLASGKAGTFLIDRYHVDPRTFSLTPVGPHSQTLAIIDLLKSYGVEIEANLVADVSCASLNMQENRGGFAFTLPVKYPFIPELTNLSFDSPVTKGLTGVILPFVSPLVVTKKDKLETTVIAESSKVSWIEREPLDINPRRNWQEASIVPDGPHALLVQALGKIPGEADTKESRLLVMGSSAFLWDDFLSQANLALGLNMVDWMVADKALLDMRARTFSDMPLDAGISDAARQAVKLGNILGVPALLVIYGLWRWRRREAKRRAIKVG